MKKINKKYFLSLTLVCLGLVFLFITTPDVAKGDSFGSVNVQCEEHGSGKGCNNYLTAVNYGDDAWKMEWSIGATGFGASGPAGGNVGVVACINQNGSMWTGQCVQAIQNNHTTVIHGPCGDSGAPYPHDGKIGDQSNCFFSGSHETDVTGYRFVNAQVYVNDAQAWGYIAVHGKTPIPEEEYPTPYPTPPVYQTPPPGYTTPPVYPTPYPTPPAGCTAVDNASNVITNSPPTTVAPGQVIPVTFHVVDTGNTRWHHGSAYQFVQTSSPSVTISPTYGHLPFGMYPGDAADWAFNVTAPSTPGSYSLSMRMMHNAGWAFLPDGGCAAPSANTPFGATATYNFTVSADANPPQGSHDLSSCTYLAAGWAYDPDSPSQSIDVHVYRDGPAGSGTLVAAVPANLLRADVNSALGITGNHGFAILLSDYPALYGATYPIYVHAIGVNASGALTGVNPIIGASPKTLPNCPPATPPPPTNPVGSCSADGTVGTFSWTAPAGYNTFYTRASLNGVNLGAPAWDDNFVGTTKTFTTVAGNTYVWWVSTKNTTTGASSASVGGSITCTDTSPTFNYSLSNSGTSNVTKSSGNAFTQNTITRTLTAGTTQGVTLALSGLPAGVTYAISNGLCYPTCASVITFTVAPSTAVGTYPITVTGSPLGRTTSFNLVVAAPAGGGSFPVACGSSPSTARVGQTVTWTAFPSGGTAPYTYSWSGTNIPTSPAPNTNPFSIVYSTLGQKSAVATVTDAVGGTASCPATTVLVYFDPDFEEF